MLTDTLDPVMVREAWGASGADVAAEECRGFLSGCVEGSGCQSADPAGDTAPADGRLEDAVRGAPAPGQGGEDRRQAIGGHAAGCTRSPCGPVRGARPGLQRALQRPQERRAVRVTRRLLRGP